MPERLNARPKGEFLMKPWQFSASLSFGLAVLAMGSAARLPASLQGPPEWQSDYELAQASARQSGKPLFVAFR
jgi:hypothetical protein